MFTMGQAAKEAGNSKVALEREREISEWEREQADKWRQTAEYNQRLLADQRPQKRGWFGFGRTS